MGSTTAAGALRAASLWVAALCWTAAALADLYAGPSDVGGPAALAASRPNVLVFLVDDLGYADLGCYGSAFYDTPNIDRLAASGMRFTDGYAACPVCSPTRASRARAGCTRAAFASLGSSAGRASPSPAA